MADQCIDLQAGGEKAGVSRFIFRPREDCPSCLDERQQVGGVVPSALKETRRLLAHLRYSYRLDPAPRLQAALARAFGCARVVYNDALAARQDAHAAGLPCPSAAELSRRLTFAKHTPQRAWQCPRCGAWLDRDVNAAVNVATAAGLAVTACGAQVRPGSVHGAAR